MSGKVVTFATGFREEPGIFGLRHEALGPFEVSASRDAVIVHRAELKTFAEVLGLVTALAQARYAAAEMGRGDQGVFIGPTSSEPAP